MDVEHLSLSALLHDVASPQTLQVLENAKVTTKDLLFGGLPGSSRSPIIKNLSLSSAEVTSLRRTLLAKLGVQGVTVAKTLSELNATAESGLTRDASLLSTGIRDLDQLLQCDGRGYVTEISGTKGSGKTVSCS